MMKRYLILLLVLSLPVSCRAKEFDLVEVLDIPILLDEWRFIVFDNYIVCNESFSDYPGQNEVCLLLYG